MTMGRIATRRRVRMRHQDYTDGEVRRARVGLPYGEDAAARVGPDSSGT